MNRECDTCGVNSECGYEHKPTECANYRKFIPADLPEAGASAERISSVIGSLPNGGLSETWNNERIGRRVD